ncbi:MAG: outer membrane beta-barrel protein [Gammaproteobacteria bacterium]|nr:outer membrane beta-barrel protein [Gammaproteobacteria bacterium]
MTTTCLRSPCQPSATTRILAATLFGLLSGLTQAATLVEDQDFTGASGNSIGSWSVQGDADFFTTTQADATNGEVARLTQALGNQSGTLVYDQAFSSSLGVQIVFDYYMAGGSGADGLAFFLVDGTEQNVTPGKSGGTLGYGTNYFTIPGVPNGYFAVGFDLFGNANNEFGDANGTAANGGAPIPNNFALLGSGNNLTGYRYLGGAVDANLGGGWRKADILVRRGDGANGCADGGTCVTVRFSTDNGGTWTTLHNAVRIDTLTGQVAIPATFKLGFSGSTGGSTNNHYIDNAQIYFDNDGFQVSASTAGSGAGTVTSSSLPSQATQLNCGAICDVAYPVNAQVTLIATEDSGSVFTGWSGDCFGTSANAVVMVSAARACTATFELTHTVSTSAGVNGSISPGNATVTQGGTTSFTVTPNPGYAIESVIGCGGTLTGSTYTTGVISAACAVTATFTPAGDVVVTSGGGGGALGWMPLLGLALFGLRRRLGMLARMVLLASIAGTASASEAGLYFGAQFGRADTDVNLGKVTADLAARGIVGTPEVSDATRNAWRVFGGYGFNDHLALEGGYTDLGEIVTRLRGTGPVNIYDVHESVPISGTGFELAAVARYPFAERYAVFARAGLWRWKSEYELLNADNTVASSTRRGTDAVFGLGAEARFSEHWSARLGWDQYRLDSDNKANVYSVGLIFNH